MGKQINYYMEYESFLKIAEKALDLGCEIIRGGHQDSIGRGYTLDLITPELIYYYFRVPEAGDITTGTDMNGKLYVKGSFCESSRCLIEAGFSHISEEERLITRNRLYCSTGYYDDSGEYIGRHESVTKIYDSLARYAKKLAPMTEVGRYKNYISPYCLKLQQEGYTLR
ncbi:MAG: hypothetical protein ILP19_06375 [Oscillospiraceae bacterium]|nr:hypothetical protein [Oscillospiraceae bacterium]